MKELKKIHFEKGDILVVRREASDSIMQAQTEGYKLDFVVPIIYAEDLEDIKVIRILNILKIYIKNLFNWR